MDDHVKAIIFIFASIIVTYLLKGLFSSSDPKNDNTKDKQIDEE